MSSSDWNNFLNEGKRAVTIVRRGLIKRGINAGESRITEFGMYIGKFQYINKFQSGCNYV